MKDMVNIVPLGSCPKCGHKQFVVSEMQLTEYLTNPDGEIIDSTCIEHNAKGMCLNCNTVFKMYATREGFIPLTRLREILFDYTPHTQVIEIVKQDNTPNPMEVTNAR